MRWIRTRTLLCYLLTISTHLLCIDAYRSKQCLRTFPNDIFLDQCPEPRDSDGHFTPALFPDPSELSVLSTETDSEEEPFDTIISLAPNTTHAVNDAILDQADNSIHSTVMTQGSTMQTAVSSAPSEERNDSTSGTRSSRTKSARKPPLLSFEEWQKHVLQNDNDRRPKRKPAGSGGRSQQIIDSLDGGFADDFGAMFEGEPNAERADNTYDEGEYIAPSHDARHKAGKTPTGEKRQFASIPLYALKERSNYASTDCAAIVRGVNKEARGSQSILYESKDQYMLNKCSADKYVIINLCEEILIDTIVLANFEFFSSTFKDFRVYVADRYPTKDWTLLGQWQARNTRDLQVFKVQDRIGWFEYIKIEFLTHYGHEYYCPLSLVRVHGMPMMEYYNLVERQGLSGDSLAVEEEYLWPSEVRQEIIQPQHDVTNTSESFPIRLEMEDDPPVILPVNDQNQLPMAIPENDEPEKAMEEIPDPVLHDAAITATVSTDDSRDEKEPSMPSSTHLEPEAPADPLTTQISPTDTASANGTTSTLEARDTEKEKSTVHVDTEVVPTPADKPQSSLDETAPSSPSATATATATATTFGSMSATDDNRNGPVKMVPNIHSKEANTQESIYKTIMKRLNALEINATLSQRYLDDQNKMLNDVFMDMERRHQEQLIVLLSRLNETASSRIENMKRRYDQWYDDLKEQTDGEMRVMTAKLSLLADQIAFERRVSMSQLVIVITLFVFLALSRGTFTMLSPIMIAQAEERKRRESAETDTLRKVTDSKRFRSNSIVPAAIPEDEPSIPPIDTQPAFMSARVRAKSDSTHLKSPFSLHKALSSSHLPLEAKLLKTDDEGSLAADSDDACVPGGHHV